MKLLFILLVVINLLVFGWEYQRQHQPPQRDVQLELPDGVKRLQLLREQESMESEVVAETAGDAADSVYSEPEPLAGVPDTAQPDIQIPGDEPAPEAGPDPGEEPEQKEEPTLVGSIESDLDAEPAPSEGPPGIDVPEPGLETHAGMVAGAPTDPGPAEQPLSPGGCFTLGVFKRLDEAETVADRIESLVADMVGRQEVQEKQIGYWVLIPAQGSRQAARNKVKELLDAGIEDVWRFTTGELANAISLGLFSRRAPAERHQREINRKGFVTEVRPRYIDQTSYWLDFRSTDDRALPPGLQEELARDYPDTELSSRECPSDASP